MRRYIKKYPLIYAGFFAFIFFLFGLGIGQTMRIEKYATQSADPHTVIKPIVSQNGSNSCIALPDFVDEENVEFDLLWEVWETLEDRFYRQPLSDEELFYGAVKGIASSLDDPYTVFFDPEEAEAFNRELEGKFEGIGAEIAIKHGRLTIVSPLPESPAEKAGLRPGDIVLVIDEEDTRDMSIEQAVFLIRGPKSTKVVLSIFSKGASEARDVTVIRDEIVIKTVSWEMVGDNNDIAYMDIFSFHEDTTKDFKRAVVELLRKQPKGIILDLRSNPGGFLDSAVDMASFWIDEGPVVKERFFDQTVENYNAHGASKLKGIKTVVLVNEGSASASEIVAGALQDYDQATIVGEQTFGKGSVQEYAELQKGAALKVTIAEWLTPNGRSIEDEGITPDIIVEMTSEDFDNDLDPQLDKAIELLQ